MLVLYTHAIIAHLNSDKNTKFTAAVHICIIMNIALYCHKLCLLYSGLYNRIKPFVVSIAWKIARLRYTWQNGSFLKIILAFLYLCSCKNNILVLYMVYGKKITWAKKPILVIFNKFGLIFSLTCLITYHCSLSALLPLYNMMLKSFYLSS